MLIALISWILCIFFKATFEIEKLNFKNIYTIGRNPPNLGLYF